MKSLSKQNVACVIRTGPTDSYLKLFWRSRPPQSVIVVGNDMYAVNTLNVLMQRKVFFHKSIVLFVCPNCNSDSLKDANSQDFLGEIWLGIPQKKPSVNVDDIVLYEVVFSYADRCLNSRAVGAWNVTNKFDGLRFKHKAQNFHMENTTMSILATNTIPYTAAYTDVTGKSRPRGYIGRVINLIREILNFTYNVTATKYDSYGELVNGSFTGGIGEFLRGKFDIAAGIYSVTPTRRKIMGFTTPIARGDMVFSAHMPDQKSGEQSDALLNAFSFRLWIGFVIVFSIAIASLFFVYNINPKDHRRLYECVPLLLAVWLMQGGDIIARSLSTKIIVLTICLFTWMLASVYNAVLFSKLTLDTGSLITTLDDLANSDYTILTTLGSSSYEIIVTSKSETLMSIARRMITINTTVRGIDAMCTKSKHCHLAGSALLYHYLSNYPGCSHYTVRETVYTDDFHLGTQPNGILHIRISKAITKLSERGLLLRLITLYNLRTGQKFNTDARQTTDTVDMHRMFGPFLMLSIGILLSLVILVLEILWNRIEQHRNALLQLANWENLKKERQKLRLKIALKTYYHSPSN